MTHASYAFVLRASPRVDYIIITYLFVFLFCSALSSLFRSFAFSFPAVSRPSPCV